MNHNPKSKNPKDIDGEIPDFKKIRLAVGMVRNMTNNDEYSNPNKVVAVEPQDYINKS